MLDRQLDTNVKRRIRGLALWGRFPSSISRILVLKAATQHEYARIASPKVLLRAISDAALAYPCNNVY